MLSEKSSGIEQENTESKPATLKQNVVLSLKLVTAGTSLVALLWFLDNHLVK